mmetsp:Transcript_28770/g.91834  ORF Transcript_28770/g.91834 Transcript_28770/m.91834 type:complete len:221 (+) Transcript_28770:2411-3073(+)
MRRSRTGVGCIESGTCTSGVAEKTFLQKPLSPSQQSINVSHSCRLTLPTDRAIARSRRPSARWDGSSTGSRSEPPRSDSSAICRRSIGSSGARSAHRSASSSCDSSRQWVSHCRWTSLTTRAALPSSRPASASTVRPTVAKAWAMAASAAASERRKVARSGSSGSRSAPLRWGRRSATASATCMYSPLISDLDSCSLKKLMYRSRARLAAAPPRFSGRAR